MMSDLLIILKLYREKLFLILLILGMPWAWAAWWVPWWVNLMCLAMVPLAGLLLVFRVLPMPEEPRRESDEVGISDASIRKMRKMSSGINNLLWRWAQVSSNSRSSIEEVATHVDDVISYSEKSIIDVSKNFINVTRKTRKQVDHALSLLERARGGSEQGAQSLPELVQAYEVMARQVVESLARISETSMQLERRHEQVRENLKHIDTLLDQLSAHDSQIGMLALNTSVAAGGSGADFVTVSDQIRTISLESKALTRDIRRTLEEVRGQSQETHAAVRQAVQQARDAAGSAEQESSKLKEGMLENSRALEQTLDQISALGNEIQADINNIIVALQFQDITQQKLQRLKHPMLTDLTTSLRAIFDETRVLSSKLQTTGMVDRSGQRAGGPDEAPPDPPAEMPAEQRPAAGVPKPKSGSDAVEIF